MLVVTREEIMHAVVTGGAGFIGSHLVDRLVLDGHQVTVIDNFSSGMPENVSMHAAFIEADIRTKAWLTKVKDVDFVFNLASPASPADYLGDPLQTLLTGSEGTLNTLRLAHEHDARYLFTSTSEVYGDPLIHPQPEDYWGNVHTTGPRACYDEAKRFSETLIDTYHRYVSLQTVIVRLFNTYGPRMRPSDGRVISTFVRQGLAGEPMTIFGDGTQTRSISYIDDTVEGIIRAAAVGHPGPINLGSPFEVNIRELSYLVAQALDVPHRVTYLPLPEDDPKMRRADTRLARQILEWNPSITPTDGIRKTVEWMKNLETER